MGKGRIDLTPLVVFTIIAAQVSTGGPKTGWIDEPEQKPLSLPFYQQWSPGWYIPVQSYNSLRTWSTPESLSQDLPGTAYVRLIEKSSQRVWPEKRVVDAVAFMKRKPSTAYEYPLPDQMITHVVIWQRSHTAGTHYLAAWPLNMSDQIGCRPLWANPITIEFSAEPFRAFFRDWTGSYEVDTLISAQPTFRIEAAVFRQPVGTRQQQVVIFRRQ